MGIPQLLLSITLPISILSIGYLITRGSEFLQRNLRSLAEILCVSFFLGASFLITVSLLIGTIIGYGLGFFFWAFYILGSILTTIFLIYSFKKFFNIRMKILFFFKQQLIYIILISLTVLFYFYYPITNTLPHSDAAEAYLPMARYFCEFDGISANTQIFLITGDKLTIPPGISLIQSFAFKITQSFDPANLAALELSFLIFFSLIVYSLSKRCNLNTNNSLLSAILMMNLPYWILYFDKSLHYIDLESAFMCAMSIFILILIINEEINETNDSHKKFPYIVLGLGLFASFSSKLQSLMIVVFIAYIAIQSHIISNKRVLSSKKFENLAIVLLSTTYLILALKLGLDMYIFTTLFGGFYFILFFALLSLVPLIVALKSDLFKSKNIQSSIMLRIVIIVLISLYWYLWQAYINASIVPTIKEQNTIWAIEILKKSMMTWGGLDYLFSKYSVTAINIFYSIYGFVFIIPLWVGLKSIANKRNLFSEGMIAWLLLGIIAFLGIFEKNWRYSIFFTFPLIIFIAEGIDQICGNILKSKTIRNSIIFVLTFPSLIIKIDLKMMLIISVVSTILWIVIINFRHIRRVAPRILRLSKPRAQGHKFSAFVLSLIIIFSCISLVPHYSKAPNISKKVLNLYQIVAEKGERDRVIITIGISGLYFHTGMNTLQLVYPECLAKIEPVVNTPDITKAADYLINELKIGGAIFRAENGGLYREWYVGLLREVPELRLLHNPHLFTTTYYDPNYFYFLSLTSTSIAPIGCLDIVARAKDSQDEVSLFLPYDYGLNSTVIATESEEIELVSYLYFPESMISSITHEVHFEASVNLTVFNTEANSENYSNSMNLRMESMKKLGKIVEIPLGSITGHDKEIPMTIRIDDITLRLLDNSVKIAFEFIPRGASHSNGTWLAYYPTKTARYSYQTWVHYGDNLIDSTSRQLYPL